MVKEENKVIIDVNRIRRITGYLISDIDKWNNAKKSELFDRVTHTSKNIEK
jgi:ribonucleoside-triphosphate reductase